MTLPLRLAAGLLALMLASCAGQSPQSPAAQVAVAPTASAAPTHAATTGFQVADANPVLQPRRAPFWDRAYLDPGAIVFDHGQFHMFYNGIDGWPRPVGVGYATSPDGVTWTRQADEPVFGAQHLPRGGGSGGTNLFVTSAVVAPDGTWMLYYYTLAGGSFMGRQTIGRATAPGPRGPWRADPEPVLTPGPAGAWDSDQVSSPHVVRTDAGYALYYDGLSGATSRIGMATSTDGIHWTKYNDPATTEPRYAAGDPVLAEQPNAWDSARVIDPNVVRADDGWVMVYQSTPGPTKFGAGVAQLGYATSRDGVHWTRSAANPVLSSTDHPRWKGIYLITLVRRGPDYLLYFDVAGAQPGVQTSVFLATHMGPLVA